MTKIITQTTKNKPFQTPATAKAAIVNPAKIFNSACPDVILANRRTAKLIIRDKFETNSIKIMNGIITKGEPFGKKWLNIKILFAKKELNQIVNIINIEKANVKAICAVIVCE